MKPTWRKPTNVVVIKTKNPETFSGFFRIIDININDMKTIVKTLDSYFRPIVWTLALSSGILFWIWVITLIRSSI